MKYVNFCLVALFSLALSSGSVKDAAPSLGYYPGEIIPEIVLTDLEGDKYMLSDFKGNKVVVNFGQLMMLNPEHQHSVTQLS